MIAALVRMAPRPPLLDPDAGDAGHLRVLRHLPAHARGELVRPLAFDDAALVHDAPGDVWPAEQPLHVGGDAAHEGAGHPPRPDEAVPGAGVRYPQPEFREGGHA